MASTAGEVVTVKYSIPLRTLEAAFVKRCVEPEGWQVVDDSKDADGVAFMCPRCWRENGGPCGTHSMLCWFVGRVPNELSPGPGRWVINPGATIDSLTFIGPDSKSIACGKHWHGFIVDGRIDVDSEGVE